MFDQIKFQDDLAQRMLSLKSFRSFFAKSDEGLRGPANRGRRRTRQAAIRQLMAIGYQWTNAYYIVQDAQDYAELLYNAGESS